VATNAHGRFLSQQRGERGPGDMTKTFNRGLPNAYAQFNQRGLGGPGIKSGTQQRAIATSSVTTQDYGGPADPSQSPQQSISAACRTQPTTRTRWLIWNCRSNRRSQTALGIQMLRPDLANGMSPAHAVLDAIPRVADPYS
jgi:hypothetical protein